MYKGQVRRLVLIQGGRSSSNEPSKAEIRTVKRTDDFSSLSDSDREEIIQMIDEFGWTDDQILHMLPHVSKGSITAYRAHVTRGTYEHGVNNGTSRRKSGVNR